MLKRLLVLVAALAAFLVFVPTASAQLPEECTGAGGADLAQCLEELNEPDGTGVPAECQGITSPARLAECLSELGTRQGLPAACDELVDEFGALDLTTLTPQQVEELTENLIACLTALVPPVTPPDDGDQPAPAADVGYGYDGYGYDIGGYDGGIPEGGVASGFGPTDPEAAGAPLVARGAALIAVLGVLATGLLMMRRRRRS